MARILLISPDETEQVRLATELRRRSHSVRMAGRCDSAALGSEGEQQPVEIVVCDVTGLDEAGRRELREFAEFVRQHPASIFMLCYSRIYRGPRFELEMERLGARFVYAG